MRGTRKITTKLSGWNTAEDIMRKLGIKKSTAYKYVCYLNKQGFVIQKIKKPRGTMYLIRPIPKFSNHLSFYEKTDLISPEIEFSARKITVEQKIAYFLHEYKKERNRRFYELSVKLIKKIKNWKNLYRYLKAYSATRIFARAYIESRKTVKKIPRMPERYKKLIGVKNAV